MSKDIVSDVLNMIMNAKVARKTSLVVTNKTSKLLIKILNLVKESGYLDYMADKGSIKIEILDLNKIKAIKPRFTTSVKNIEKYVRRYLPARNFGFVIISTNKGLMKHSEAIEKNLGGCLIAYIY
jgi:small subunit ribosomal protein S8